MILITSNTKFPKKMSSLFLTLIITDMNEMGSAIIIVEDNGKHSIGQHCKEDHDRQDPSHWRRKSYPVALTVVNRAILLSIDHGKWVKSSPVVLSLCREIFSPASSSSNLQALLLLHLACFDGYHSFLILILAQNLAGDDILKSHHSQL